MEPPELDKDLSFGDDSPEKSAIGLSSARGGEK
jgi:hypothetical protein